MSRKTLPPLNWLRTFEVSARSLNFTRAAQELNLTQGAVSQQIRLLESHLGVDLFKRLPRGLSLTEEGQSYLPVVQDSVSRLAAATSELFSKEDRSLVKIRGSLSFLTLWLAPKLNDFKVMHPNIDLRYLSNLWVRDMGDEDELEIRWGNGHWPGLLSQRLTWDTLFPVCSPSLIEKQPIESIADLAEHTLLHVMGYEEGWGYWLSMVNEVSVDPSQGMQLDTLLAAIKMAEVGLGVGLARSSMVEDALADGRLVELFDQRVPASESFYLVCRSGVKLSHEASVFFDWLGNQARPY
ncbi:Glycine cleavage system transcriptional activator [Marinomonas spartinae]|uniref:Glycine cleavage system transcriptional activator n=1 Tax=Marinomonas spartinae TaxID=1792290 RepID=A0A1A8TCJ4_9GAMM|nr:LysR substrate-binding domain-containing protein [Marinomonas spartinae]SBS30778.1 Glycine cleavage system transcriptional activator [Marinomonas spartinae]